MERPFACNADTIPAAWYGDLSDEVVIDHNGYCGHVERMSKNYWWAQVFTVDPECSAMFERGHKATGSRMAMRDDPQFVKHRASECECKSLNAADHSLFWYGKKRGGESARRWCEWVIKDHVLDLYDRRSRRKPRDAARSAREGE